MMGQRVRRVRRGREPNLPGAALAILWMLSLAAIGAAEAGLGGTVTDAAGRPLAGVMVTALDGERRASTTVFSDAQGGFDFPQLASGAYRVTARRIGFEPRILDGVAPDDPPLRFALPPKEDFAEDLPAA